MQKGNCVCSCLKEKRSDFFLSELKYKRILLKVSGEALGEKTERGDGFGLNF